MPKRERERDKLEWEGTSKPNLVIVMSAIYDQKLVREGYRAFYSNLQEDKFVFPPITLNCDMLLPSSVFK